ncbi:hypothetical protein ACFFQF_15700 [Haladaptatus pallidirubidus]|uniref:Phospholipase_D-nuclease N-terminal n=1 Tax=Haladaptatus pallidirubidus TaxID=1008152 RepID=A0AAV3UCU8_9EURY|nr:hypothetical protein [Haladaptatus pallidirubidus]
MSDFVVSVTIVLLFLQFLLWVLVTIDVRGAENPNLKWFAIVTLSPGIGLLVSSWYFSNRSDLRGGTDDARDASDD